MRPFRIPIESMAQNNLFNIDLEQFQSRVLDESHKQLVLVDLWADWCAPYKIIAPILKQIAEEYESELCIAKLEVDEGHNMKIAGQYKVRGFPTIILFKNGEEVDRFSSAQSFRFIEQFVQPHL